MCLQREHLSLCHLSIVYSRLSLPSRSISGTEYKCLLEMMHVFFSDLFYLIARTKLTHLRHDRCRYSPVTANIRYFNIEKQLGGPDDTHAITYFTQITHDLRVHIGKENFILFVFNE